MSTDRETARQHVSYVDEIINRTNQPYPSKAAVSALMYALHSGHKSRGEVPPPHQELVGTATAMILEKSGIAQPTEQLASGMVEPAAVDGSVQMRDTMGNA